MSNNPPPLIPFPFSFDEFCQRLSRNTAQLITKFLNNLIDISVVPFPLETFPGDIFTIPFIREHHDSCGYYLDTESLTENPDEPPLSIPFTSMSRSS